MVKGWSDVSPSSSTVDRPNGSRRSWYHAIVLAGLLSLGLVYLQPSALSWFIGGEHRDGSCHSPVRSPFGHFPETDDPFQFIPCTNESTLPALEEQHPRKAWAAKFDPNPEHWSWGAKTHGSEHIHAQYAGRGIFMCGYLDVPLDYLNSSDTRIVRLAVTKFQVAGLSRHRHVARKSERTLIVNPGGPGGSGTRMVWGSAENTTRRFSDSEYDVLSWDPRGVNASLPGMNCFPYDADRDRWSLSTQQSRRMAHADPRSQLEITDAWSEAKFAACKKIHGDLPRFMTTAVVARDLEQIRIALGEPDVSGWFVSYGTGIGQTYANMFPDHVGRLILDGTEYVRDHRLLGGFGWTALDNATDAWHDGFLGECVAAGPDACDLADPSQPDSVEALANLEHRMATLLASVAERPFVGYTESSGPSLITHSLLVLFIYQALYNPFKWPELATALSHLEQGNTTLIASLLDQSWWEYDPTARSVSHQTDELGDMVICADSYDAPQPPFDGDNDDGLDWWDSLWSNMTEQNWIAGDSRFYNVFPCRQFNRVFGPPAELFRGDLNHTLSNPVLLIAETYDPATPLRNGRRLLNEMGQNARLIVHHGYGHSSRDTSSCTDDIAKKYILSGTLPKESETNCYADEKPYRYSAKMQEKARVEYLLQ